MFLFKLLSNYTQLKFYMDYFYENLGDERFQEFCSCLISKEFTNVQVYPVGQPDGGRDSIAYLMPHHSLKHEYIIFQVKFVRNPYEDRNVHKWLINTIKGELEKINKLIPKGASQYILLTNVKGTAHLESGAIDQLQKYLDNNIAIPSQCWWRDDLSRLFEKDPLFKWSFPEILNGQDMLNSILFNSIQENKEKREHVINAYLVDQFDIDNEVKFKQIDLQNKLLNLFTDVPLRLKKYNEKDLNLLRLLNSNFMDFEYNLDYSETPNIGGAAEFLLHPTVQNTIERILLEGGPGQGKSTISQYICQVHRARLLNKQSDIELIPSNLRNAPIRLPFKIDLRDIASWVEKKNPYKETLSDSYFEDKWKNSLEAFLVAHIYFHSQLDDFTPTDFIAICKISPILFVFDGFDEIADIKIRGLVIEFINKGINRISVNAKSIQIVITSRPAAFSDSVEFSIDNYPHFELTDITPSKISEYVEKWIKASKLGNRDASELKKLIEEKLKMPHLKDLAKSPMQLAIFISLLKTKGQSLPNKRTALYDNYIDLFFDRESEKNNLIRDKRDLIINIHKYLAWVLHSEAELYTNSGSIHIQELNSRLKEYLTNEGHDTSIADQLFDVMKERVCALVSRVQGTFEFEVQPLREYFCAKYLYESAPHSSAGCTKTGTKPDRLNAILRNFYWQNVVRFFAGCADAGELDMIIQELKDLQDDPLLKYTNYPKTITSQILSDYVFTQKPLKLKNVVKIIIDGIKLGNIINQDSEYPSNDSIILPNECGRIELLKECFEQLCKMPNNDYATELIGIINNNNPANKLELWLENVKELEGNDLTKWLEYGYKLRLIHRMDSDFLLKILNESNEAFQLSKRIQILISGNRMEIIEGDPLLKRTMFRSILNNELNFAKRKNIDNGSALYFLTFVLHPYILSYMIKGNSSNVTFINYISQMFNFNQDFNSINLFEVYDDIDSDIKKYLDSISEIINVPITNFKIEIKYWDILIENARVSFGENLKLDIIATIAAGIKSKEVIFEEFKYLNDYSLSLCKRVRYARMKSGNVKFWKKNLIESESKQLALIVFLTWATPKTIVQLLSELNKIINDLDENEIKILINAIRVTTENSKFDKIQQSTLKDIFEKNIEMDLLIYLLSFRFEEFERKKYIYNYVKYPKVDTRQIAEIKFEYIVYAYLENTRNTNLLDEIQKSYKYIQQFDERHFYYRRRNGYEKKIPYEIAKKIMKNCNDYPRVISSLAEKACRNYANKNLRPVGEVAKNCNWFETD